MIGNQLQCWIKREELKWWKYTNHVDKIFQVLHKGTDEYDEAIDTINNHCKNYDKMVEIDKLTDKYCSENPWTTSGS